MPSQEHVHIITAGDDIATTYTASFRDYPGITRTYVFSDNTLYFRHADPEIEKARFTVRNAISAAKNTSTSIGIPFSNEVISAPAYPAVRDALTRIHREHPGARYTFDLSGGSKPLCMALLALAPWVNGEIRSAFDERVPRSVPLPYLPARAMLANPNYQTILALLVKHGRNEKKTTAPVPVSRQYLYQQLWPLYVMARARKDPPAAIYKKGRKAADELTQPTFSGFMVALVDAGLTEEVSSGENRKEKYYRLTEMGGMAFRFGSDPATNTLVKTVLETLC
ncbi:hypothetical protein [Methanoregula sp.]|jgi:hypothetical protein|uniref:hypothetical protein n=1 Tax=Methanoregula sp. TaxID=2052170 RepID=UPI003563E92C